MSFGAAASIGGSLLGSALSSKAAKGSASTQSNSADQAMALLKQQNQIAMGYQQPFYNTGSAANAKLSSLLGLDSFKAYSRQRYLADNNGVKPDSWQDVVNKTEDYRNDYNADNGRLTRSFSMDDYQADPGYQFRLDEGNKALERSQAARGGLLSGAAVKAASAYNSGQASQEYGNAYNRFTNDQNNLYNRLSGLSSSGQGAANTIGQLSSNYGNQIADLTTSQGAVQGAGQVASTNAWTTGLNQVGQQFNPNQFSNFGQTAYHDPYNEYIDWGKK